MEKIGIIAEYNPFHRGHLYHIQKIKEKYPDSLIILVLNGYFLERGEISFLTKEDKVKIALEYGIDLVLELPVVFGTQSADIFAKYALQLLNEVQVNRIIFGSESNNLDILTKIADLQLASDYQTKVKNFLKEGVNYPTALAKALNITFDFNNPNDLLGISYIKTIKENNYNIRYETIKRTNNYHDLNSDEEVISASNIRNRLLKGENILKYTFSNVNNKIIIPNFNLYFTLLKAKILTTPNLDNFLTVDEGIENRLQKQIKNVSNLKDFQNTLKTKRYTYNKINRMFIHILLGITKKDVHNLKLDYLKVLGFTKKGQEYLNQIKSNLNLPLDINSKSYIYQKELIASLVYDLINNTNTFTYEKLNKPIIKD